MVKVRVSVRVVVRVRVLSASTCLPWPVVVRYDTSCSYVGYNVRTYALTEVRHYEVLSTYNEFTHLKKIFYIRNGA